MKIFTSSDSQIVQKYLLSTLTNFEKRVKRSDVFVAISDKISTKMEQAEFCEALSKSIRDGKIAGFEVVRGKHGGVRLVDPASAKLSLNHSELAEKAEAAPTEEVVVPPSNDEDTAAAEAELELLKMKKGFAGEKDKKWLEDKEKKPEFPGSLNKKPKTEQIVPEAKPYLQNRPLTTLYTSKWLWINDSRYSVQMTISVIERFITHVMRAKIDSEGPIVFNGKKYSGDEQLLHRFLTEFVGARVDVSPPLLETADVNGVPLHFIDEINKSPSPQTLADWNKKQIVENTTLSRMGLDFSPPGSKL